MSAQDGDNAREDVGCGAGPAETPSAQLLARLENGIVSSLISFTSVAGGLCVCLSVVTLVRRLVQHAVVLLG
jgi:hypothetical protein